MSDANNKLRSRRDGLNKLALDAEDEVSEYLDGAHTDALTLFKNVALWVGDIRSFWLVQKPVNDGWWLDRTEEQLQVALDSFRRLKAHVDKLGGPTNLRKS
jgi:hypothetical protein